MNPFAKAEPKTKARGKNESFKDYKKRLKREKEELKVFKKGRVFYNEGGTYIAPKRKKATA